MFKGKYKSKNQYGQPILYQKGDVILNQGKLFECLVTTNFSPLQEPKSWLMTNSSNAYSGSSPPLNPIENQLWISDSGIQYVYYKDTDGYQWIAT